MSAPASVGGHVVTNGRVVGLQLFGAGGLPSGEAIVTIAPDGQQGGMIVLRLGGPGTNPAGQVTDALFEERAARLIRLYCQRGSAAFVSADVGGSLPDIVSVDGV